METEKSVCFCVKALFHTFFTHFLCMKHCFRMCTFGKRIYFAKFAHKLQPNAAYDTIINPKSKEYGKKNHNSKRYPQTEEIYL